MTVVFQPWQLLWTLFVGWITEHSQRRIDYLQTELTVVTEAYGPRRILLTDDQRRRLAVKGKLLGRKALSEIGSVFSPETILCWHRELVARKWDYSARRKTSLGRPTIPQVVVDLVLRFARENPTWGYDRIADSLAVVGHTVSDQTVGNVLKGHGIEPAPKRRTENDLGHVSESSLGTAVGDRLHHSGSLDGNRHRKG